MLDLIVDGLVGVGAGFLGGEPRSLLFCEADAV